MSEPTHKPVRVRIRRKESNYDCQIGYIQFSMANGSFWVRVDVEGDPHIELKPTEVEPC